LKGLSTHKELAFWWDELFRVFLSMYTRLYGQQAYENESGQMFSMRIIFIWEFTRGSSEKFPEEFSLVTKPQYVAYPYGEISNHPALVFHAWNYSGFPRFIPSKARA